MMAISEAKEVYSQRLSEVDLCFINMEKLSVKNRSKNNDFFKIAKSSFIIMLYNMIEACFYNIMIEIYKRINSLKFQEIKREIQLILIEGKIHKEIKDNITRSNLKKIIIDFLDLFQNNNNKNMNFDAFHLKNNLDNTSIKKIFNNHKINYKIPNSCQEELLITVRSIRNQLAHGESSFVNCSKEITMKDLKEMKEAICEFLLIILDAAEKYCIQEDYKI